MYLSETWVVYTGGVAVAIIWKRSFSTIPQGTWGRDCGMVVLPRYISQKWEELQTFSNLLCADCNDRVVYYIVETACSGRIMFYGVNVREGVNIQAIQWDFPY